MKKILLALALLLPQVGFAQAVEQQSVAGILDFIIELINIAVPIIIALAVLVFLWGVLRYVVASDEEAKGKGKNMMLWGIVGIFVMVSVWGLVNILQNTFNLEENAPDNIDLLPGELENAN